MASQWGHLFGGSAGELVAIAKQAGVPRPFVEQRGDSHQHVKLCGSPLLRVARAKPKK
jgi:hypothetical protein